jgi:dihydrolipoamide dehydrogenase
LATTGEPMLAHRAMAQGEMVAEIIAGGVGTSCLQ